MPMVRTAGAAGAIPVLGDCKVKGISAKMSDLAKEFDGSFCITAFEFTVCGTHAAERLKLAGRANCLTSAFGLTDFLEAAVPSLLESTVTKTGAVLVRKNANRHLALRIDGTSVLPATAGVFFGALRPNRAGYFFFGHLQKLRLTNGIAKIERDDLFWGQTNGERALRTVGAGIHERIELEFGAKFVLGEALHFMDFVKIDSGGDGLQLERETAFRKQLNTFHATVERAGNLRQSVS